MPLSCSPVLYSTSVTRMRTGRLTERNNGPVVFSRSNTDIDVSIHSFHSLATTDGRWRLRTQSIVLVKPPSVHDSIFRIQLVLGRRPWMSNSITNRGELSGLRFLCPYLATFRRITVLNIPFSLLTPTVCLTHSFVFLTVHFTLSIRRQHDTSDDSIILSSSFFSVQLSQPYNATLQTSDLTDVSSGLDWFIWDV